MPIKTLKKVLRSIEDAHDKQFGIGEYSVPPYQKSPKKLPDKDIDVSPDEIPIKGSASPKVKLKNYEKSFDEAAKKEAK